MADTLYVDSTILLYHEVWDKSLSEEKPAYRPHDAWLVPADVAEITLTIRKPGDTPDEVKTLSGGGIIYTGKVGRWQSDFDFDGGPGTYAAIFVVESTEGKTEVEVTRIRAKAWPA